MTVELEADDRSRPAPAERLLVIDLSVIGDRSASGEMKAAVLANWPADRLLQLYDSGGGKLRLVGQDGRASAANDPDSLRAAIAAFEPDLILYRPVPRKPALHRFAMDLITRENVPLALWILDDWPSAYATEDPGPAAVLDADLRWLIDRADVRFSISPEMSAAFHERYGRPFVPIANGVDPADWPPARPRAAGPVTVRYAGNLADNMTLASVGLVADAIERLAEDGVEVSLEVKATPYWRGKIGDWGAGFRHTTLSTSDLSIADYRRWLAEADILLLAYNFDARSREYIRYSLANKLPECLASGAAVLAVGPADVGTIATMVGLDVGERVTVEDPDAIEAALRRLVADPGLRFQIAERAQAIAFSLFNVRQTRRAFEDSVSRVAVAHSRGAYRRAPGRVGPPPPPRRAPGRPSAAPDPSTLARMRRFARRAARSLWRRRPWKADRA